IYGNPKIFDTCGTYCLPVVPYGLHYCGYVVNHGPVVQGTSEFRRTCHFSRERFVYVSAGGGADGDLLMRTYLRAIRLLGPRADFATLMAVGINAPKAVFRELEAMAQGLPVQLVSLRRRQPECDRRRRSGCLHGWIQHVIGGHELGEKVLG